MFSYLNGILYKVNTDISNIDTDSDFQSYLIQRWSTMYSPYIAVLINETTNIYWQSLDNNTCWYMMLDTSIPKCKFKRLNYLKKAKKDIDSKNKEQIQKIANNLEISSREVISYIKHNNLTINND